VARRLAIASRGLRKLPMMLSAFARPEGRPRLRRRAWRSASAQPQDTLPRVKRLRAFFERLPGGHRPPTGPLTTTEATDAEELRQETLAKDQQRIGHEQDEASDDRDREVPPD
jgi:hypothetical protein